MVATNGSLSPSGVPLPPATAPVAFDPDWKERFHLTLSFADGSPARTYAIQSGLRPYRPTYMHFWQLKTFWHSEKVCADDVEVHSFEDMEVDPPTSAGELDPMLAQVTEEMNKFRDEFARVAGLGDGGSDLRQFWLRKSRKPVLAVLLARGADGKPRLFRGTNLEVSMPTGSLCAERNVIGTALASNVGMRRGDLMCVAVLAVNLDGAQGEGGGNPPPLSLNSPEDSPVLSLADHRDPGAPGPPPAVSLETGAENRAKSPVRRSPQTNVP
ncbi:hypothetical protein TeGR_g8421, partial [Tetraparma gracilis]